MARVKINIPDQFSFFTEMPIRITDLNYGGHVGNDSVLSILHEARLRFLKHIGATELNAFGVGLIMADAAIEFRKEMHYGDTLKAWICADDISRAGFDLYYKLERSNSQKSLEVAVLAKTAMVGFDYQAGRIKALPEALKEALQEYT